MTGDAMVSAFTLSLTKIHMWEWRQMIFLMIWNEFEGELRLLLDHAKEWNRNIKPDYKISKSLRFPDVLLITIVVFYPYLYIINQ